METGELRYYHSSQNNSRFFYVPHLIRTEEDLEKYLDELQGQDILEFIRQKRPDTKWVVHLLTNKGNNKITELRTILQRESKNS